MGAAAEAAAAAATAAVAAAVMTMTRRGVPLPAVDPPLKRNLFAFRRNFEQKTPIASIS